MDELASVVTEYVQGKYDQGTDWYKWKFKPDDVPSGVSCRLLGKNDDNWYRFNVDLKHELQRVWRQHPERRAEVERYYIAVWGGVRGNRDTTLDSYHLASVEENIARGSTGIASWSKALCVRDPSTYAIFDARVSSSLNALQIIHRPRIKAPVRFPRLVSRNTIVKQADAHLREHFKANAWPEVLPTFYMDYLSICKTVAVSLGKPGQPMPIYAVEMALFAHTEQLLGTAFDLGDSGQPSDHPGLASSAGSNPRIST